MQQHLQRLEQEAENKKIALQKRKQQTAEEMSQLRAEHNQARKQDAINNEGS